VATAATFSHGSSPRRWSRSRLLIGWGMAGVGAKVLSVRSAGRSFRPVSYRRTSPGEYAREQRRGRLDAQEWWDLPLLHVDRRPADARSIPQRDLPQPGVRGVLL
jgi:hypothetical protein